MYTASGSHSVKHNITLQYKSSGTEVAALFPLCPCKRSGDACQEQSASDEQASAQRRGIHRLELNQGQHIVFLVPGRSSCTREEGCDKSCMCRHA